VLVVAGGLVFEHAARSEQARRPNNEDRAFASPQLVAVADGVGGAAAGEVASQLAIGALSALEGRYLEGTLDDALPRAVRDGNERIRFVAACRPRWAGMASTLAAVGLDEDRYVVANVGDSRVYLLRGRRLARLTTDDTYVQLLVERGVLTEEQALRHPQRSVVVNVLDGDPTRRPKVTATTAKAGDRLLLCSDGLSDVVDEDTIERLLLLDDREACADGLVRCALERGAGDNVSVVVTDVVRGRDSPGGWRRISR
jgi:PPM family protein phosphatase